MKQVKILSLIAVFSLFILILASCVPGGTQPAQGWSGTIFNDGIIYVSSMDGKVMAVDPSARKQELPFPSSNGEWSFTIATTPSGGMSCGSSSMPVSMYGTPAVINDLVYMGIYNGKVLAINPSTRSQDLPFPQMKDREWAYPRTDKAIEPIVGSPAVDENSVYVSSSDGRVYALDMSLGDEKWKSEPLSDKLWTTPVIKDSTLYVSTFDGHIYTLSTEDGRILPWTFEGEAGFVSSPVLYKDTIFVGSFDRNLYAVKIGADKPLWKFPAGNWFWAAPVISEEIIYAGCLDGKIYAIDADSGKEVWKEPFDAESPIVASPLLVDGSLVVAAESGNVYVINPKTGIGERIKNPKNDNRPSIDARVWASLCANEGVVYVRGQDNWLYALDIEKGRITWKLPLTIEE